MFRKYRGIQKHIKLWINVETNSKLYTYPEKMEIRKHIEKYKIYIEGIEIYRHIYQNIENIETYSKIWKIQNNIQNQTDGMQVAFVAESSTIGRRTT